MTPNDIIKCDDSNFPQFIKLKISNDLIDKINTITEKYKSNVKDAVVYSLIEQKHIMSEQRVSLKTSFHDEALIKILYDQLIVIINKMLNETYKNVSFNVEIGPQSFDYIKYETDGYFEKHKDFIRISNKNQQQYTLLIGLSHNAGWFDGHTILWFPVDETNNDDYEYLINFPELDENQSQFKTLNDNNLIKLKNILAKYYIPSFTNRSINQYIKYIRDNTRDIKYMPYFFNTLVKGNALLFKSDIVHSGEKFSSYNQNKELLGITVNVTCLESSDEFPLDSIKLTEHWSNDKTNPIIVFDKFEPWMIDWADKNNLLPFQIILNSGKYNQKNFNYNYIRYWNLSNDINDSESTDLLSQISKILLEIYDLTKKKLNHRGRETLLNSKILDQTSDLNIDHLKFMKFNVKSITTNETINLIDTFTINYVDNLLINNQTIKHVEKIVNRWEESGCNDSGDEYDDQTYLNCNIDIKFCFCK